VSITAVIDTNVWVSAFLNPEGYPARLMRAGEPGQFSVVVSLPLIEELLEVPQRPRILKIRNTTAEQVRSYVKGIVELARVVSVDEVPRLCRDPDDDVLVQTAIIGGATHIVSRDEDITRDLTLLEQLQARGIQAMTISRFLDELGITART